MIVSGVSQDKMTTNSLVQYAGVGIDLGERSPSAKKIGEAVAKVLADDSYSKKGKILSKEYDKYDVGRVFDQTVQEVVRKWKSGKRRQGEKKEL